jgi:hypothetical protein
MDKLEGGNFNKFIVFKGEDADKYLPNHDLVDLGHILRQINDGRKKEGKSTNNKYLVINTDEPYADEVIAILKRNGHWG